MRPLAAMIHPVAPDDKITQFWICTRRFSISIVFICKGWLIKLNVFKIFFIYYIIFSLKCKLYSSAITNGRDKILEVLIGSLVKCFHIGLPPKQIFYLFILPNIHSKLLGYSISLYNLNGKNTIFKTWNYLIFICCFIKLKFFC